MKTFISIISIATSLLLASCAKDTVEPATLEDVPSNGQLAAIDPQFPVLAAAASAPGTTTGYVDVTMTDDAAGSTTGISTGYVDATMTDDGGSSTIVVVAGVDDHQVLGCSQLDVDLVLAGEARIPITSITNVRPDTLYRILIDDPVLVQLLVEGKAEIRAGLPCGADGYTPLQPGQLYVSVAANF